MAEHGQQVQVLVAHDQGRHAFGAQSLHQSCAGHADRLDIKGHAVDVVHVGSARIHLGCRQATKSTQSCVEFSGDALATLHSALQLAQLHGCDSRLDFAHAEVVAQHVAQLFHVICANHGFGMVANQAEAMGQAVVVGDQHAAFAAVDVLVIVEAEASDVGQRARVRVTCASTGGLSGVAKQLQAMTVRNLTQARHVSGLPKDVHSENGLGALGDKLLDTLRADVEGLGVNVREDRDAIPVQDCGGRRCHGPRRGDDLVTWLKANSADSSDQAGGPGVDRNGVFHAEVGGGLCLEFLHLSPPHETGARCTDVGRQHTATDHFTCRGHFVFANAMETLERG